MKEQTGVGRKDKKSKEGGSTGEEGRKKKRNWETGGRGSKEGGTGKQVDVERKAEIGTYNFGWTQDTELNALHPAQFGAGKLKSVVPHLFSANA